MYPYIYINSARAEPRNAPSTGKDRDFGIPVDREFSEEPEAWTTEGYPTENPKLNPWNTGTDPIETEGQPMVQHSSFPNAWYYRTPSEHTESTLDPTARQRVGTRVVNALEHALSTR